METQELVDECEDEFGQGTEECEECVEERLSLNCDSNIYGMIFVVAMNSGVIEKLDQAGGIPYLCIFEPPIPNRAEILKELRSGEELDSPKIKNPVIWIEGTKSPRLPQRFLELIENDNKVATKIWAVLIQPMKDKIKAYATEIGKNIDWMDGASNWGF